MAEPVVVPTSAAEESVWFLHALAGEVPVYSIPLLIHLEGALNQAGLARALRRVAMRQESLRAEFLEYDGGPVKVIRPEPFEYLEVIGSESEAEIDRLVGQPFDLDQPPLLRAYLVAVGDHSWDLIINVHHIVFDDWSLDILVDELSAAYREDAAGTPAELPDLALQYVDYAAWQRRWLDGDEASRERAHWHQRLADVPPPLPLPPAAGAEEPRLAGGQTIFTIDWNLFQAVRDASHELGVTTFAFLLAGFGLTLWHHSSSEEFLISTVVANRPTQDLERLIGFFANTVAVRFGVSEDEDVSGHVRAAQEMAREALAHGSLPIRDVVHAVGSLRRGGSAPLGNVGFSLRGAFPSLNLPDVTTTTRLLHNGGSLLDLTLIVEELQQGGLGTIDFSRAVDPQFVDEFAADYLRVLAATSSTPNIDLATLRGRVGQQAAEL